MKYFEVLPSCLVKRISSFHSSPIVLWFGMTMMLVETGRCGSEENGRKSKNWRRIEKLKFTLFFSKPKATQKINYLDYIPLECCKHPQETNRVRAKCSVPYRKFIHSILLPVVFLSFKSITSRGDFPNATFVLRQMFVVRTYVHKGNLSELSPVYPNRLQHLILTSE